MMPILFRVPFIERDIPGYGLMLMIGFLASIMWAARRAARSGANPDVILNCGFVCLIAGVIGSRSMYVVHYWDQFKDRGTPMQVAWAVIDVSKGGLEHYGGLLLAVTCTALWLRFRERVSLRWYFDIMAPSAALGLCFGRLGCFLNGCCFGAPCDLPWHIRFPFGSQAHVQHWTEKDQRAAVPEQLLFTLPSGQALPIPREDLAATDGDIAKAAEADAAARKALADAKAAADSETDPGRKKALEQQVAAKREAAESAARTHPFVRAQMEKYKLSAAELRNLARTVHSAPVHPAQLYSSFTAFLVAMVLSAVYWRRTRDGQVIFTMFLIEPVARWLLELVRADNPVDTAGFTISQFLALCMTAFGLIGLLVLRKMSPRSPRAQVWTPEPIDAKQAGGKAPPIAGAPPRPAGVQ